MNLPWVYMCSPSWTPLPPPTPYHPSPYLLDQLLLIPELSFCPDWMEPRKNVTYFVLLGLTQNPKEQKVLSVMFLFFYILTLIGNLVIIVTIPVSKTLNSPMYFFVASLSFIDVTYSSCITPRMISDLFLGEKIISFESCMTQLFTEHFFGGSEIIFLLVNGLWPLRGHL